MIIAKEKGKFDPLILIFSMIWKGALYENFYLKKDTILKAWFCSFCSVMIHYRFGSMPCRYFGKVMSHLVLRNVCVARYPIHDVIKVVSIFMVSTMSEFVRIFGNIAKCQEKRQDIRIFNQNVRNCHDIKGVGGGVQGQIEIFIDCKNSTF